MAKKESDKDKNKKKKDEEIPLDKKALEDKFNLEKTEDDKRKKKPVIFKPKETFDRSKYIKEKSKHVQYKPDSFIPMSKAFQDLTMFPGFPQGHVHMVYGLSDCGKTTMLLELAKGAQSKNILPVFVITEKKWSWKRCAIMGIDKNDCVYNDELDFIEEACDYIVSVLKDQAEGRLNSDIVILWDSVGATPSRAEWEAQEEHDNLVKKAVADGKDPKEVKKSTTAMMVTSKVLREQIERKVNHLINRTRNEKFPYLATLFIVNHGYVSPNPMGPASLVPYGGGGIKLACTFMFRQGKVSGGAKKISATVGGTDIVYGLQVPLVFEKNHLNGLSPQGEVIVTPHGYIHATKEGEEEYKKAHRGDWKDSFKGYFTDEDAEGGDDDDEMNVDPETGEILS